MNAAHKGADNTQNMKRNNHFMKMISMKQPVVLIQLMCCQVS